MEYAQAALAVANFIKGMGGSKQSAVLNGFDVQGTAGPGGFAGSVTAFDQKGDRWSASNEIVDAKAREVFAGLPSDFTVPVSFRAGPGTADANQMDVQNLSSGAFSAAKNAFNPISHAFQSASDTVANLLHPATSPVVVRTLQPISATENLSLNYSRIALWGALAALIVFIVLKFKGH